MSFIWFLLSVLVAAFFYFRLAKRIANLNLELSGELKTEIISLIAEFNHSAQTNISLIEERSATAKEISKEIAQQLAYMKKLKETMEKEIKEAEIRLKTIISNERSVAQQNQLKKTAIAHAYEEITKKTLPVLEKKSEDQAPKNTQDIKNGLMLEQKNHETASEKKPTVKEQAIALQDQGFSVEEIAQQLKISRGEVDLYLKFAKARNESFRPI